MQKRNLLHFVMCSNYKESYMETIEQMSNETLLKILKCREDRINELEKEIILYQQIIKELMEKASKNEEN